VGGRSLERPRNKWEDNIKMDLKEMGWGDVLVFVRLRMVTGGVNL
jgi:hypothetical protein